MVVRHKRALSITNCPGSGLIQVRSRNNGPRDRGPSVFPGAEAPDEARGYGAFRSGFFTAVLSLQRPMSKATRVSSFRAASSAVQ